MSPGAAKDRFPRNFSLLFTFVFFFAYWPGMLGIQVDGVFARPENVWNDLLFKFRGPRLKTGDPRILIAALDEDTGKKFGFPVPRFVEAELLDKLRGLGVKTVAFDVMFYEPREGDEALAAANRRFGRVINAFSFFEHRTKFGTVISMSEPVPGLKKTSQYLGHVMVGKALDGDGHIRRCLPFYPEIKDPLDPAHSAPSIDSAMLASFLDQPLSEVRERFAARQARTLYVNFRWPQEWLRHPKRDEKQAGVVQNPDTVTGCYRHVSVVDIMSGELSAAQKAALKGSLVIVGSTSLGAFDHYPNPFNALAPGDEYHANNVDNMLHDDFLRVTPRMDILLVLIAFIWLPVVLLRFPPVISSLVVAGVLLSWLGLTYWRFCGGVRTEFVAPAAALVIAFLAQTVHRVRTEGAEKKFIKQMFGQFVSPDVVDKLVRDPSLVKLGGEKRDMTVFFLDIAHFTTISEKMSPEALLSFLNKYLSALSQVIQDRKGTVDKYIGDCIMAFWNAPVDVPDHRAMACLAAVECQAKMAELNKDLDPSLPETPMARIGLNAGDMNVGLTGSQQKLAYTVIGDEVNLGSRLEGANKFFGSSIMASEAVFSGARHAVEGRELGRVLVVGKAVPIRVYELLAKKGGLSPEWTKALPLYEAGLKSFYQREFGQAALAFEEVLKILPKDGPAAFYLNISRDYSALPPPQEWDGVIKLTAK